jgi:hypothetical protein
MKAAVSSEAFSPVCQTKSSQKLSSKSVIHREVYYVLNFLKPI